MKKRKKIHSSQTLVVKTTVKVTAACIFANSELIYGNIIGTNGGAKFPRILGMGVLEFLTHKGCQTSWGCIIYAAMPCDTDISD